MTPMGPSICGGVGGGGGGGVGGMIAVYKHQSDLCDVSVLVVAIDRP